MKKKKFASALLAAGVVFGSGAAFVPAQAQAAADMPVNFTVIVEDKELTVDPQPFVVDNRTFVPLRALSEGLGADVQYDANTNIATITKDDVVLKLNFNTGSVTKNGTAIEINPAPRFVNYRTMVPVRFISEAFGNEVKWDAYTSTVQVLPTAKTLQKREAIWDVLSKSNTATNAKNNLSMDFNLTGTIPNGSYNIDLAGPFSMKFTKDPLAMSVNAKFTGTVLGQSQTQNMEMYMMDGYMYMKDPASGEWEKQKLAEAEWQQLVNTTLTGGVPANNDEAAKVVLPYATMTEDADSYNVTVKLDKNGLNRVIKAAGELQYQQGMPMSPIPTLPEGKQSMNEYYEIDKTTYLQNNLDLNLEVAVPGETVPVQMHVSGTVNYDPLTITLPEVAKNADDIGSSYTL